MCQIKDIEREFQSLESIMNMKNKGINLNLKKG